MPRAMPDTTASPAAARSDASISAMRRPAADALRAPTSATARDDSTATSPSTAKAGGATFIRASKGG